MNDYRRDYTTAGFGRSETWTSYIPLGDQPDRSCMSTNRTLLLEPARQNRTIHTFFNMANSGSAYSCLKGNGFTAEPTFFRQSVKDPISAGLGRFFSTLFGPSNAKTNTDPLAITYERRDLETLPLGVTHEVSGTPLRLKETTPYYDAITRWSAYNGLDPAIVAAQVQQESSFNPKAQHTPSNGNPPSKGLMQLQDGTFAQYGKGVIWDPDNNIQAGTAYLGKLVDTFTNGKLAGTRTRAVPVAGDDVLKCALAAYNWGPVNVAKLQNVYLQSGGPASYAAIEEHLPQITRKYVASILENSVAYRVSGPKI